MKAHRPIGLVSRRGAPPSGERGEGQGLWRLALVGDLAGPVSRHGALGICPDTSQSMISAELEQTNIETLIAQYQHYIVNADDLYFSVF